MQNFQTTLIDREEFYATVVDIVLYYYKSANCIRVRTQDDLRRWLEGAPSLAEKSDVQQLVIIDEFFLQDPLEMEKLLNSIKTALPKAKLISYSTSKQDEVANTKLYDYFAEKTGRSTEKTLISAISEITGQTITENEPDPEYQ